MCLYSNLVQNPKYKPNKKNGGHIPAVVDTRVLVVPISCGNCIECRKAKAREWQLRMLEEIKENKKLIDDYYNGLQQERIDKNNADIKEKEIKQNEDLLKARKAAADASIEITKAETEAKEKLQDSYLNAIGAGIGILKMFAEKNKGLQKALLIAENGLTIARIILDTQRGIVAAKATLLGIPPFLPGPLPLPNPKYIKAAVLANASVAQAKINAGIGIAQALAATAKGLSSIGGGGSAGGGGSVNAGGGVGGGAGGNGIIRLWWIY